MTCSIALNQNDVFVTLSGRLTTPFPRANYKRESKNSLAIHEWLKENSMLEAQETGNSYMETLTKALNPKNWSPADSAQCNLFLFGDDIGRIGNRKFTG